MVDFTQLYVQNMMKSIGMRLFILCLEPVLWMQSNNFLHGQYFSNIILKENTDYCALLDDTLLFL